MMEMQRTIKYDADGVQGFGKEVMGVLCGGKLKHNLPHRTLHGDGLAGAWICGKP